MGLFSKIKKAFKKVFKGIKKVFKKVGEFAGKVLNSKFGKALMIAAAVFTGGAALMAGIGNFAATSGTFITKFMAGAKGFMAGLMNPMQTWKGAIGGVQEGTGLLAGAVEGSGVGAAAAETAVSQAANAGEMVEAGGAGTAEALEAAATAPSAADAGLSVGGARPGFPGAAEVAAAEGTAAAAPVASGNLLTKGVDLAKKFGSGALDLAKTPGGGLIISNALQGLGQGKIMEDQLKYGDYYDRKWADPRQQLILEEASNRAGEGFLARSRRYATTRDNAVTRPAVRGYQRGERVYATGVTGG